MYFKYNNALVDKARELRKNMTPEEAHLWYHFLRDYPIRFLRQKVVDDYILDFYCSKARLCVELDGNQHASVANMEYDAVRTGKLNQLDIHVIRFTNEQVNISFAEVCNEIDHMVLKSINKE